MDVLNLVIGDDEENVNFQLHHALVEASTVLGMEDFVNKCSLPHLAVALDTAVARRKQAFESNPDQAKLAIRDAGFVDPDRASLEELRHWAVLADVAYDDKQEEHGDTRTRLRASGFETLINDESATIKKPAYFLGYDKEKKTVVVGVKGTSTLGDMVTDVLGVPHHFIRSDGKPGIAHSGNFAAASYVAERVLPAIRDLFLPSGYRVVLLGHSLGAATASLVALLVRAAVGPGVDLHCFAFAPPPNMDESTALWCAPDVTSIVHCDDAVTRTSLQNVRGLLTELERATADGAELFQDAVGAAMRGAGLGDVVDATSGIFGSIVSAVSGGGGEEEKKADEQAKAKQDAEAAAAVEVPAEKRFFVPGSVTCFVRCAEGKYAGGAGMSALYPALQRMEVGADALADHGMNGYLAAIDSLLE
jgi:hypothetical protein